LVTRFGFKPVLVTGLTITAGGLLWFSRVHAGGSYVGDVLFPSLLAAIGLGLAFVSMTVAAVSGVEPHEAGLASGLFNTSQQIGGALGLAILATVANTRTDHAVAAGKAAPVALTEGFQNAFLVAAAIAMAGAILATVLVSSRASREHVKRRSAVGSTPSLGGSEPKWGPSLVAGGQRRPADRISTYDNSECLGGR
jgi:sugar phosphate permease